MTPVTAAAVIRDGLDETPATSAETPESKRGRAMQAIADWSARARHVLILPIAAVGALAAAELTKPGSALAQSYALPAVYAQDEADGQASPSALGSPGQPRIVLAAVSVPASPQSPSIVLAAAPQVAAAAPANTPIGIDISPELEQNYGVALAQAAAQIQEDVTKRRGSIINRVSVRSTSLAPIKNPDNTIDWGRIAGGLNNPLAKLYSIDVLSTGAKPGDPYSQVVAILGYVANEKHNENYAWRTKYVNRDNPNQPASAEDTAAYQRDMAKFRGDFLGALAARPEPMRTEICRRMVEAMRAAEASVGPMKLGAIYRFFTTRADLVAELAIINEKLPTAGADKAALQARKNAIIETSLLDLSDAQSLIARLVAPPGITPAVALFADVQLPDPQGSGQSVSISHFADFAKISANKGIKLGTTRGYVTPDGARVLENIPGIAAATPTVTKGFKFEVANTIESMPKQVSAVNDWGIEYYNQVLNTANMSRNLGEHTAQLIKRINQSNRGPVLDPASKKIYQDAQELASKLRTRLAMLKPGTARFVPLMATGVTDLIDSEAMLLERMSIKNLEDLSVLIQRANPDIVASKV